VHALSPTPTGSLCEVTASTIDFVTPWIRDRDLAFSGSVWCVRRAGGGFRPKARQIDFRMSKWYEDGLEVEKGKRPRSRPNYERAGMRGGEGVASWHLSLLHLHSYVFLFVRSDYVPFSCPWNLRLRLVPKCKTKTAAAERLMPCHN
jgi:hypothetical protein